MLHLKEDSIPCPYSSQQSRQDQIVSENGSYTNYAELPQAFIQSKCYYEWIFTGLVTHRAS